jgi:hypothetical protein
MALLIKANVTAAPNSPFDIALNAPLARPTLQAKCPGHAKRMHYGTRGAIVDGWERLKRFRRSYFDNRGPSKARQIEASNGPRNMKYRGVEYTVVQGIEGGSGSGPRMCKARS